MRIYFSEGQRPMLLDSLVGMNALHNQLREFVLSNSTQLAVAADQSGAAAPYRELLGGLEIRKTEAPLFLSLTPNRWLLLTGSQQHLTRYVSFFRFDEDEEGAHHHPEYVQEAEHMTTGTMSLVIEVDSHWIDELRAKS